MTHEEMTKLIYNIVRHNFPDIRSVNIPPFYNGVFYILCQYINVLDDIEDILGKPLSRLDGAIVPYVVYPIGRLFE
jgi:hypothetical protein